MRQSLLDIAQQEGATGWRQARGFVWICRTMVLVAVAVLAGAGCDLLDPTKCDNPIFGPPPPRKTTAAAADKGDKGEKPKYAFAESPASDKGDDKSAAEGAVQRTAFSGDKRDKKNSSAWMSGNEVVASVNGQPIFASEIFERAYTERLSQDGLTLMFVAKMLEQGRVNEIEREELKRRYRVMQEAAIKRYLRDYIRTRVLAQAMVATFEKDQKQKIEDALTKMYDEYVDKLKKEFKVESRIDVDQKLKEQGSSLKSLKAEFQNRLMADEYVRSKAKKDHVVGREEILAYYQAHLEDYDEPERVRWQLLEIQFDKHGGQKKALERLEKAVAELERGESFSKVVKKYSDDARADEGGKQPWARPESIAEEKTAATLHELKVGETSSVLKTKGAFRLVRLIERKAAGRKPLAKAQDEIKRKLEDQLQREAIKKVVDDAFLRSSIESSYLTPEEANTPAEDAAAPTTVLQKPTASKKKRRDRS